MKVAIALLLLVLGAPGALASIEALQECQGCHFSQRSESEGVFASGFGRWSDEQCFGCHQEITQVAANLKKGVADKRYYGLPVSDKRLKALDTHPMSYLDAPTQPFHQNQQTKVSANSLAGYLRRPHGECNTKGCKAPPMMAYPLLKDLQLAEILPVIEVDSSLQQAGEAVFNTKCSTCHQTSQPSGYNPVALSLFSADWIYSYANGNHRPKDTQMPKIALSKAEASQLTSYFLTQRQRQELALDKAQAVLFSNYQALSDKPLPAPMVNYIWQGFWRDTGCVHCHSIEGRAHEKFDTSIAGIKGWLSNNSPFALYERLAIRTLEAKHGIGAQTPGMPMTGEPLPEHLINLIGRWLRAGCADTRQQQHCHQQTKESYANAAD